jgi:hypothetical protein
MAEHLREQHSFYYNKQQRIPRRTSATYEDLQERRTGSSAPPQTDEEEDTRKSVGVIGKSAIRHRPIGTMYIVPFSDGTAMRVTEHELGTLPENYQNAAQLIPPQVATPRKRREPHPRVPIQDDSVYDMPPARTHRGETDALPKQHHQRRRFHWLFWLGIAMVSMLAGSILFTMVANWWQVTQDDWHYGRPRTYQIDANVGHGTAHNPYSHFIALNLNRHIEVIEIAGNDPAHSKIYVGPTLIGPGEELAPVTLSFEDMNNDGKPDVVIHVGDSKVIFLNQSDGTFKPAPNQ